MLSKLIIKLQQTRKCGVTSGRLVGQQNRIESRDRQNIKGQLIFDKDAKVIHGFVEKTQQMMPELLDIHVQTNKSQPFLYTIHKN